MITHLPPSPFVTEPDRRFVLDVDAFMAEIEPAPKFLSDPSPDYLRATEIVPVLKVLAAY